MCASGQMFAYSTRRAATITTGTTTSYARESSSYQRGRSSLTAPSSKANATKTAVTQPGLGSRLRFHWTLVVAGLCFVLIGIPAIVTGYLLRWLFGIEGFIFPFAKWGCRLNTR